MKAAKIALSFSLLFISTGAFARSRSYELGYAVGQLVGVLLVIGLVLYFVLRKKK